MTDDLDRVIRDARTGQLGQSQKPQRQTSWIAVSIVVLLFIVVAFGISAFVSRQESSTNCGGTASRNPFVASPKQCVTYWWDRL